MPHSPVRPQVLTRTPRTAPTGILQVVHLDATKHTWEVAPGTVVHGYGYNAQVPGPTLEATVGDTLLVRFTNSLPEPTSICWPGLPTPAGSRADDDVVRASTPVPPGGTLEHRLELPHAGTFAYHPHIDCTRQIECGLYGALVVRDPAEPVLDDERVLVLSDLGFAPPDGHAALAAVPEKSDGREGGLLLVNGVQEAQMLVTAGHRERWRLVNATVSRRLRLSLSGQPVTVTSAGRGRLAAPVVVNELLLGPGERRDLVVGPFTAGQSLTFDALRHDHGSGASLSGRLATLHVA
jgi:FtsP/CotA-like multicopper oxidase with cupredoxin domain